jgi:predicted enzyme related to lactoylglutathione lyase
MIGPDPLVPLNGDPSMEAVDVRGRFVWHQLLTRDIPGAKTFYSKLLGWKMQPWPPDPTFTVCHAGDAPTAGLMPMAPEFPAEVPAHWMQYIGTRDVDAVAEAAVLAGGYIVKQPADMKGAGRYAVLADPQGAVFAIIDPETARAEPEGTPPVAQFSWHELATTDNEAAFAFYSNLFGWDAMQRMDMGPVGVYLIFGQNGVQKGGMYIKPQDMPGQPFWLPYCRVPSVDDSVAVIEKGGGKIMQPPMDVPGGGRISILMDPSGAGFALHSVAAPADTAAAEPARKTAAGTSKSSVKAAPKPKAKKPKTKAKAKVKAKVKAKAKAKAKKPAARPKAKAKTKAKARPKSKAKAKPKKTSARRKK